MDAELAVLRAQKAGLSAGKRTPEKQAKIDAVSRELHAAVIKKRVRELVAEAPPLDDETTDYLVGLLRGGAA